MGYSLEDVDISSIIPKGVNVSHCSIQNPVKNLPFEWIHFTNSYLFSPAANFYNETEKKYKKGRYTNAIPGTIEYKKYWAEETKRCIHGYEPMIDGILGGIRITGEHYFYINYCRILRKTKNKFTGEDVKEEGFPEFLSMDYYYFHTLEWNENPLKFGRLAKDKKGLIVGKSRRKGFSYKNAGGCLHKYTFYPQSYCVIGAYLKEKAQATMKMVLTMSNFLNEHTEFFLNRAIDRNDIITSGRIEKVNGQDTVVGFKSTIQMMTFGDSGFKSVGLSATRFVFEEAGIFENLIEAYELTKYLFRDGNIMIGIPIIFGTGGDMESATKGFAEMFYNPNKYGLCGFTNIYDLNTNGSCGYFVDEMWFRPGEVEINGDVLELVDKDGNPNRWASEVDLDNERNLKKGSNKAGYILTITQNCKTPSEAFMVPDGNIFPIAELYDRLSKLKADDAYKYIGTPGELIFSDDEAAINGIKFLADMENKLNPLYEFPSKVGMDREGCIIIYDAPVLIDGEIPSDMYFIGHDPYAMNTDTGESLGATFVLMSPKYMSYGGNKIVAEYVGRPSGGNSMTVYNTNLEKLSLFYGNAKIMYEVSTGQGDVLNHFTKKKKLALLAGKPTLMLSRNIGTVKSGYTYGCATNEVNKGDLEQYVYDWLLEIRGEAEDGRKITTIDTLPSRGLIEELIMYSRKINTDRVSSLFMLMVMIQERTNKFAEEVKVKKETAMDWLSNNKTIFPNRNQSPKNDKWVFKL